MPFKKGQSGNPAGRKVGSKNKITLVKEQLIEILRERMNEFKDDKKLSTTDLFRGAVSLMPKEHNIDAKVKSEGTQIIINYPKKESTSSNGKVGS